MTENKKNAQLKVNQLITKGKRSWIQSAGHIGEVKIVNFSDGTKTVEFVSADGEIDFTLVTYEPFYASSAEPIVRFVPPEAAALFPYWAISFRAYLRCKVPSERCPTCEFLTKCQELNSTSNNSKNTVGKTP